MNILLFGATGMVGQGAVREALLDPQVARVISVLRRPSGCSHAKLNEIVLPDITAAGAVEPLPTFDAVLYCVGVTALGLSEAEYTRQTFDLTLDLATRLARVNPASVFVYVSCAGADGSERARLMWARVKGRTENALLGLPFRAAYMFRPGFIQPLHGIRSRTGWYRALYAVTQPLAPMLIRLLPGLVTTTERLGRSMLKVAEAGFERPILDTAEINGIQ